MTITRFVLVAIVLTLPLTGCATMWPPKPATEDVAQQQAARKADVVQAFETKRDTAQFEAAMARWRDGDADGCKELTDRLLARTPRHRGGLLLNAELQLIAGRPDVVISDIAQLVDENPTDAEASHMLGLLLEATGQPQSALPHFERALEVSPDNQVFAASYQSALVGEPTLEISGMDASVADPQSTESRSPTNRPIAVRSRSIDNSAGPNKQLRLDGN